MIEKEFDKGSILDLECETGSVLEHLNLESENYLGLDISEKMLEIINTKYYDYKFLKDVKISEMWRFGGSILIRILF